MKVEQSFFLNLCHQSNKATKKFYFKHLIKGKKLQTEGERLFFEIKAHINSVNIFHDQESFFKDFG